MLNQYRRLVKLRGIGVLISSILSLKLGFGSEKKSLRALERWGFFQRLTGEGRIQPLVAGDQEFRVRYSGPPQSKRSVEVALRVPYSDSSDSLVFDQIFIRKEYLGALQWFDSVSPGEEIRTVIDVGANIGCAALFFFMQFPEVNIFCLEPEQSNYDQLELNVGLNRFAQIRCLRAALSAQPGRLQLSRDFRDGKHWGARFVATDGGGDAVAQVQQADAIDAWELLRRAGFENVDLLKMDIEGGEAALLEDVAFGRFLREKVRRLVMEVHEEFIGVDKANNILRSLGFTTFQVAEFVCGIQSAPATDSAPGK
jgi:FkbM family methyltransferase